MTSTELSNASKVMLGSTEVSSMYIGSTLVWQLNQLPYDCLIEYLESSGTLHIITNLYGNETLGFEVKCNLTSLRSPEDSNSATVLGSRQSYNNRGFLFSTFENGTLQFSSALNTNVANGLSTSTDYIFKLQDDRVYVNDVSNKQISTNYTFTTPNKIVLFALDQAGSMVEHLQGKIYYVKFFNRTTLELIADFIPVRIGLIGYMYDKISGQLFGNDGTGNFTLGPDK